MNDKKMRQAPNILLVEDNMMNQQVIQLMLEKKNYTCDIAINGKEALKMVGEGSYDIIFMDCQMPVMDGFQATMEIRQLVNLEKMPHIIAMTANALSGDKQKCLSAGMTDYLPKPTSIDGLISMVEKYWLKRSESESKGCIEMVDSWYGMDFMEEGMKEFMEKNGFDENIARKLYTDYVNQLPQMLNSMEMALAESNLENLSKLAHQLKGSSGMLRIAKVAEMCAILEMAAKKSDKVQVSEVIEKIKWLYDL